MNEFKEKEVDTNSPIGTGAPLLNNHLHGLRQAINNGEDANTIFRAHIASHINSGEYFSAALQLDEIWDKKYDQQKSMKDEILTLLLNDLLENTDDFFDQFFTELRHIHQALVDLKKLEGSEKIESLQRLEEGITSLVSNFKPHLKDIIWEKAIIRDTISVVWDMSAIINLGIIINSLYKGINTEKIEGNEIEYELTKLCIRLCRVAKLLAKIKDLELGSTAKRIIKFIKVPLDTNKITSRSMLFQQYISKFEDELEKIKPSSIGDKRELVSSRADYVGNFTSSYINF